MAYDFATRLQRLRTRKQELDSVTVTYDGSDITAIPSISASRGKTDTQELDAGGNLIVGSYRDYIFTASDLSSMGRDPRPGDTITESVSGLVCKVISTGEESFRYIYPDRTGIRVHTVVKST